MVYVIGAAALEAVKIGVSKNLTRRLQTLQTGSPVRLRVLWSTSGKQELEAQLHARFAEYRTHGEWFALRPGDPVQQVKQAVEELTAGPKDDGWPRTPWSAYDDALPYYCHPEEATAGRCVCGHQIGSHLQSSSLDLPCGGAAPYKGHFFFDTNPCDCPRFADSPSALIRYRAEAEERAQASRQIREARQG